MDKIRVEMKCNDRFFNAGMAAAVIILAIWFRSVYKELHADHETGAADNK